MFFVTGACLERDLLPLDNLLSHICDVVGLDYLWAALDPCSRGTDSFSDLLDFVAAMPFDRRLNIGGELAEHFELDQARLRAESGIFLDPEDLSGLAAYGCEIANHTRTHLFCIQISDETSGHDELVAHARRLESLTGHPVRAFSYPYGRRDDARPLVERILRESGHEASFLAESRPHLGGTVGRLWNRVALDGCPTWRIGAELELMPTLRVGRDRLQDVARASAGFRAACRATRSPPGLNARQGLKAGRNAKRVKARLEHGEARNTEVPDGRVIRTLEVANRRAPTRPIVGAG